MGTPCWGLQGKLRGRAQGEASGARRARVGVSRTGDPRQGPGRASSSPTTRCCCGPGAAPAGSWVAMPSPQRVVSSHFWPVNSVSLDFPCPSPVLFSTGGPPPRGRKGRASPPPSLCSGGGHGGDTDPEADSSVLGNWLGEAWPKNSCRRAQSQAAPGTPGDQKSSLCLFSPRKAAGAQQGKAPGARGPRRHLCPQLGPPPWTLAATAPREAGKVLEDSQGQSLGDGDGGGLLPPAPQGWGFSLRGKQTPSGSQEPALKFSGIF